MLVFDWLRQHWLEGLAEGVFLVKIVGSDTRHLDEIKRFKLIHEGYNKQIKFGF